MFSNILGPKGVGEILKAVASPIGSAGGAVGGILKQTGILDEMGKILDGASKKPGKGMGLSGMAEKMKNMLENMLPPTGLMDPPAFPDLGGKLSPAGLAKKGAAGYGGAQGGKSAGVGGGAVSGALGALAGGAYAGGKGGGAISGALGGVGGVFAGGKGAISKALSGAGAATGAGGAGLATMMQKAIFIATMQKMIQDIASKPNFNMDRAISDVWMQLNQLRAQQEMAKMTEMLKIADSLMKKQQEMQKSIIGNIR